MEVAYQNSRTWINLETLWKRHWRESSDTFKWEFNWTNLAEQLMYVDRMLLTCTNWCLDWCWVSVCFPSAFTTRSIAGSLQMRYLAIVLSWFFIRIPWVNPWDLPEVWFASSRPSLPWGIIYCRLVTWSRWGRGAGEDFFHFSQEDGDIVESVDSCEYHHKITTKNNKPMAKILWGRKHLFHKKGFKSIQQLSKNEIKWTWYPEAKSLHEPLESLPWISGQVQKRTEPKIGSVTQKETAAVTFYGLVLEDGSLEELEVQESVPDHKSHSLEMFRDTNWIAAFNAVERLQKCRML